MHQQLWGYKVEGKLYVGVREQKRLNTAGLEHCHKMSSGNASSLGRLAWSGTKLPMEITLKE